MKNLPFSGDMATARAEGRKDITRRVIPFEDPGGAWLAKCEDGIATFGSMVPQDDPLPLEVKCRWRPGDVVFHGEPLAQRLEQVGRRVRVFASYQRDRELVKGPGLVDWRWKPKALAARYCPAVCARLFSLIVSVRAERLHEITEEDARREGVTVARFRDTGGVWVPVLTPYRPREGRLTSAHAYRATFANLWDEKNCERAPWSSNPWVWRIELQELSREEAFEAERFEKAKERPRRTRPVDHDPERALPA